MNTATDPTKLQLTNTDCPRTQKAQDESWVKYGNRNDYMRMIEAYAFACRLERENAALRKQMAEAEREFSREARCIAADARFQERQWQEGGY